MFGNVEIPRNKIPSNKFEGEIVSNIQSERLDIEDLYEAREFVEDMIEEGVNPFVTVPEEYAEDILKKGVFFLPKEDKKTGRKFSFVAGTLGIDPYLPEDTERYVMEVDVNNVRLEPRFTGTDRHFHGVVGFPDGIPADCFKPLGKFSKKSWTEFLEKKRPLH